MVCWSRCCIRLHRVSLLFVVTVLCCFYVCVFISLLLLLMFLAGVSSSAMTFLAS